jgi:TatD DNase family protein
MWIDTHAHLDAPEFGLNGAQAVQARMQARERGVGLCVVPSVCPANFGAVRQWAHTQGDAYALGIHPLWVPQTLDADLQALDDELALRRSDPRLVAVGEIGLDFFVPALCEPTMRQRQIEVYRAQLRLARKHGLPVILHVRRSADVLLKHLRELPVAGIAHAFNGSDQQAKHFVDLGFVLGFGGAMTFEAARQLRRLAAELPLSALVLETDAPDIPPQWLYVTAAQRAGGQPQGINTPAEIPRIGEVLAQLRGQTLQTVAQATSANACRVLPRLQALLDGRTT